MQHVEEVKGKPNCKIRRPYCKQNLLEFVGSVTRCPNLTESSARTRQTWG